MKFDRIDWNRAFFKTYYEKRTAGHLLVNFNRIWVIHISLFFYYTAYNSPAIYEIHGTSHPAMTWSAVALGGAVSTVIMILATLAEFTYIPTTWNNTSHLGRRLLFLFVVLGITCGPTFYVAIAVSNGSGGQIPLILGMVQFFISIVATLLFGLVPSGRMFGDRVAGKSRKYLASQTFTASYPSLTPRARLASCMLWLLVFGCKFVESYYYLTLSFKDPIRVMVGMKIQGCNDKFFGNGLCRNQVAITLAIMFVMDLVLFFLDTFLWYVIWNTVFSVGRSFSLGLSIWTPWNEIFTRLPKRIYSKLLATEHIETKYKPKVCRSRRRLRKKADLLFRSWFPKYGTRSSSPCIASTFFPSITFRSCCTTRSIRAPIDAACVHRRSSSRKVTSRSRASFSRETARLSAGSPSLHSR